MISIGSFLEIYFYVWRFKQDDLSLWLSIIIGTGLTLTLTALIFKRNYKAVFVIIVPLALYSVFATSAGQAFSLNEKVDEEEQAAVSSEYIAQEIQDKEKEIFGIDEEIELLKAAIGKTVTGLENAWEYKGTLERSQARIDLLRVEKKELSAALFDLRKSATTHSNVTIRAKNIYTFYADMLNFSEYWLQFILQTILSAFIAIMAPAGMILFNSKEEPQPKKKKRKKVIGVSPEDVNEWVDIGWFGVRSGRSEELVPEATFQEYQKRHGKEFDKSKYDSILGESHRLHLVEKDGRIKEKREDVATKKLIDQFVQGNLFEHREAE